MADLQMEEIFSTSHFILNQSTEPPWYVIRMPGGVGGEAS